MNSGHAELVVDGKTILGDAPSLIRYIFLSKSINVQENQLYPKKPSTAEKRRVIDSYLDYVEQMVQRTSSKITKLVFQRLLHLYQKSSGNDQEQENQLEMNLYDHGQNA